jgi:membrane protein DedA with SNARE-associated domain
MGLESKPIDDIRGVFERNPARTISLSKITLGIGVAGIYLAGHAKIPYSKFIQVCLLTSCIQYVFYLGLGILFGSAYQEISHYLDVFAAASILIVMAMILFLFIQSKLKKI